ncbi:PREDICTED: FBD-associated F-box protein At5g27750-like [Camelina sativa]|uniref:FBD-associated F-box protein At5g27750-like n=1 Tax=Camelina sativa TaxID=90675 RepID=A0ABM1QBY0_CAMSA|nr:PREDICTED: FBD-associated F-box protein At5g27750-like [Camelina sativa]
MPGFDRLSELPESLITQILLCLPTKESAKTSVLSTRWKNLWLNVPGLDLNRQDVRNVDKQVFINIIDRFLEFNPESRLEKFKVNYSSREILGFKDRISTAINRGIRLLDAVSSTQHGKDDGSLDPYIEFMPLNLFTSKTLVSLKLLFSVLEDPGFVSLPCLKFMILHKVRWSGTMNLEKLVSGCPVLEELNLMRDMDEDKLVVACVRSRSLKRFDVPLAHEPLRRSRVPNTLLEIDAPGLEYMTLKQDHFGRVVVKNLTALVMVDLDIKFVVTYGMSFYTEDLSKRNEIRDFLTGISRARHMIISEKTVTALDRYSKVGTIPIFNNISRLQAVFPSSLLSVLPAFLESFPNLKNLSLTIYFAKEETVKLKLVDVPQCLVSTLECVEIKRLFEWEEEEMKIVSYFLENSAVLKKLIVSFVLDYPRYASNSEVYEELNKLTKHSRRCRIIVEEELE